MKTLKCFFIMVTLVNLMACGASDITLEKIGPGPVPTVDKEEIKRGGLPDLAPNLNFMITNIGQEFLLHQLSHVATSEFLCHSVINDQDGIIRISFYPQFRVTLNNQDLVSTKSICDLSTEGQLNDQTGEKKVIYKGHGGLTKNWDLNEYSLSYEVSLPDPVYFQVKWNGDWPDAKAGRISCQTASGQNKGGKKIFDGTISCELVPKTLVN